MSNMKDETLKAATHALDIILYIWVADEGYWNATG